jgi:hypothetical protein
MSATDRPGRLLTAHHFSISIFANVLTMHFRPSSYISMGSPPSSTYAGILPSAKSFSSFAISARLPAALIAALILFFSSSVQMRSFEGVSEPLVKVGTTKPLDLMPIILEARSVGSSTVPNSSTDLRRSASRTFTKSRKRTVGTRWRTQ